VARPTAAEFCLGDRVRNAGSETRQKDTQGSARLVRSGDSVSTSATILRRSKGGSQQGRMKDVVSRQFIPGEQVEAQRDTQTSNAFEASAAHTAGQGSGASEGSLRRKCGDVQAD